MNQFVLETFPLEDIMIEIQKVIIDFEKNNHLKAQLLELRDIYQELHDASHTINNIFRWSIPLCIGFDFHEILVDAYWIIRVWLSNDDYNPLINVVFPIMWLSWHLTHIFFLSHACHSTSRKVSEIGSF